MKYLSKIRNRKLNNKGNTLGIVIVGISLLGILGSMLLNITFVNYQMKIADNVSKQSFYYVEKAVDEIYAGIGAEVMIAVKSAYDDALTNMVWYEDNIIKTKTDDELQTLFEEKFFGIVCGKYQNNPGTAGEELADRLATLRSYIKNDTPGVTVTLDALADTNITFDSSNTILTFKDIHIEATTNKGYYSSVTTDFVIDLPMMNLGFSDTRVRNWDEFFKFSMVADGYQSAVLYNSKTPEETLLKAATIDISGGSSNPTKVFGSIFAGSARDTRKNSISLTNGATLNAASTNVIAVGPINMMNSSANFVGVGVEDGERHESAAPWMKGTDELRAYGLLGEEASKPLHLWANSLVSNIPTGATPEIAEAAAVNLYVEGDSFIADDLEVNSNNTTVNIIGNYFGYGYAGTDLQESAGTAANNNELSGATGYMHYDHEDRSAIIINGKKANVKLMPNTYDDVLMLAGRAYINLDNGSYNNATYMTGESVSLKGNQTIYKAPLNLLGSLVTTNPMTLEALKNAGGLVLDGTNYKLNTTKMNDSGYQASEVVAKRTNSHIYFYNKPNSPYNQTETFYKAVTENDAKRKSLAEQAAHLEVQNMLLGNETLPYDKIFAAGIITQVKDGALVENFMTPNETGMGTGGKPSPQFYRYSREMEYRYKYLTAELRTDYYDQPYGDLAEYNEDELNDPGDVKSTVYSYFISESKIADYLRSLRTDLYEEMNPLGNTAIPESEVGKMLNRVFGAKAAEVQPGVVVTNKDAYTVASNCNYGIIIATGDVVVNSNFTGMIICGGNIKVAGGVEISACPELVRFLATYDPALQKVLGNIRGNAEDDNAVDLSSLDYQNIIAISNWRKNYNIDNLES